VGCRDFLLARGIRSKRGIVLIATLLVLALRAITRRHGKAILDAHRLSTADVPGNKLSAIVCRQRSHAGCAHVSVGKELRPEQVHLRIPDTVLTP